MKLNIKQINDLCTGVKLAIELKSSNDKVKKFLTIEGYSYNFNNEYIELDKFITNKNLDNIYFELKIYEISKNLDVNSWDITEDNLENKIFKRDIKGIKKLEIILSNYIKDFSILKPEWYCENLPWV